jgi:hypothetical protein
MNIARWVAFPAAIAISLTAAGCDGGSSSGSPPPSPPPSPAVLAKNVRAALQGAKSAHIGGTLNKGGKRMGLNLSLTRAGGVSGQLSVDGAGFTVLSTQGSTYFRVTRAFIKYLKLSPSACTLTCGKFLKASPAQSRSLVGDLSMSGLLGSLTSSAPKYRYAGAATINGQPAWVLHVSDGTTAYVASHGRPYPLRLVAPGHRGELNFTRWNTATIPGPPPVSQVVDPSQLEG